MGKRRASDFPSASAEQAADVENVSPDPDQELIEGEEDGEQKAIDMLQIVSGALASRRNEWVTARASQGHDYRWAEDVMQYNGKDFANRTGSQMMDSVQQGYPVTSHAAVQTRSTVFVQVTRQKTNAMAARLSDVVLPTDDRNFSVGPTPLPTLPSWVQTPANAYDTGPATGGTPQASPAAAQATQMGGAPPVGGPQPAAQVPGAISAPTAGASAVAGAYQADPVDAATQKVLANWAEAKKRGDAMQQEIDECLEQADYNAEARKVIFDQALYGTGVMKGPVVVNRTHKAWNMSTDMNGQPIWSLDIVEELKPASFRVSPPCFFPDPLCGENVQNGRGAFEYEKKTSKQVRDLLKQPGYLQSQVIKCLTEGPQSGKSQNHLGDLEDRDLVPGDVFEHWYYWGEIDLDTLKAAGIKPDDATEKDVVSACVEMINSTIVRAYLNPLPDGALPYDMAPLERVPGSCWGYGVPMIMRAQQRVINAAWRMLLDNAGVSSGPQIVVKANSIQPADKQWTLTSRKIWYANEDVEDVNKAFATFEFPSHQAELQSIIEMADRLSDQETAVPMMSATQGSGAGPASVGGMQMLMQGASTMLKRLVKIFDDCITKPHIRRYYNYLMEYSPKGEIKGDFNVVALGSSALVIRDIQNQALQNMLQLATNPVYAPMINAKKLFEKALRAQHIDPCEVMNTDAEISTAIQTAQQNQQPDPRVQVAQTRAKSDEDRTAASIKISEDTLANKHDIALQNLQFRRENLQIEREIEMLKLAQLEKVSLEQIRASLAGIAIKERGRQDSAALDHHIEAAQGGEPRQKSWE